MKVAPYTVAFVGLAMLVALLGAAGIAGGTSTACIGCHPECADEWSAAAHAGVECHLCHQRPGVTGVFEQRARMLTMFGSAVVQREHVRAAVPNAHCILCHAEVTHEVVASNGVRVRHEDMVEQGRRCTDCHNTVTHGEVVTVARGPAMDVCMTCHDAASPLGACGTCHIPDAKRVRNGIETPWQITHSVTWRYTHGLGDRTTCRTCHPRGYCTRCHGIDLPHSAAWNNTHGTVARQVPQTCDPCHESTLCSGCHSTDMPHPDGFLPTHSAEALKDRDACLGCHLDAACEACHVAHIHPGLTPRDIETLRSGARR